MFMGRFGPLSLGAKALNNISKIEGIDGCESLKKPAPRVRRGAVLEGFW